jgi:hypothetical protein
MQAQDAKSDAKPDAVGKPDDKAMDSELSPDDAAGQSRCAAGHSTEE